jgi:hypothetical protein
VNIEQKLEKTKEIVTQAVVKAMEMSVKLDDVARKAIILEGESGKFINGTKKVNRCCKI